jgi:hypothetical protein
LNHPNIDRTGPRACAGLHIENARSQALERSRGNERIGFLEGEERCVSELSWRP